jgi:hypothetical protein
MAATAEMKPGSKVTFTVTKLPAKESLRKTIFRLMRQETRVQRALDKLAKGRADGGNDVHQRGGRMWHSRKKASRVVTLKTGASFTITATPQLSADLKSVEKYLSRKG